MKEMTWGEYAGRRWGDVIDKDPKFDLECKACQRVIQEEVPISPFEFDFDEWIMADDYADLNDDEIVEGLAEYLADCLADGEGSRYYDNSDGIYHLPPDET